MPVNADTRVGELALAIRASTPLGPDDSVARAARLLRARNASLLLVATGPQLVGAVYEADLLAFVAGSEDPRARLRGATVGQVMRPLELILSVHQSLREAAEQLLQLGLPAAPVAGADGRYLGVLTQRDVVAALGGEPVPSQIAGMATPFGVRLTTGALRAGAGNWAVASNGMAMMAVGLLGTLGIESLFGWAHRRWPALPLGTEWADLVGGLLAMLIFLLLLRLSPLSAIHAAEHMVVHAIEEGEDLTVEKVRPMPRVHPRCGTNLVALVVLITLGYEVLTSGLTGAYSDLVLLGLIVLVLMTWRRLGHALQRFISTKRPSDRQLAGAIRVGEELLAKLVARPGARANVFVRMWNTGFLQVLAGFLAVYGVVEGVRALLHW